MENMAKTYKVKIGGREFPLAFTLRTLIRLKQDNPDFDVSDIGKAASDPDDMVRILYYMMEDAAKLAGKTLDVDREWIALHIPVNARKFIAIQLAINHAATEGMKMEAEEDEDEGREVDLVLQEIQKKSGKTDSAGDGSQPGGSSPA